MKVMINLDLYTGTPWYWILSWNALEISLFPLSLDSFKCTSLHHLCVLYKVCMYSMKLWNWWWQSMYVLLFWNQPLMISDSYVHSSVLQAGEPSSPRTGRNNRQRSPSTPNAPDPKMLQRGLVSRSLSLTLNLNFIPSSLSCAILAST